MRPGMIGYRILAYVSLLLGLAGVVLPLLPTTPFVLLSAWAAGRSSPAFLQWLHQHPTLGPVIHNWQHRQVVPSSAKWLAVGTLATSWLMLFWLDASAWLLAGLGLFFCSLTVFLLSRPSR